MQAVATSLLVFLLVLHCTDVATAAKLRVLFLPLDERFTTRDILLNMAQLTPFEIVTPPTSMLPRLKQPADLDGLSKFLDENVPSSDVLLLSAEMFLYGGLIASRVSNDTSSLVMNRLQRLVDYKIKHRDLRVYLSTVVMRIPSYNGDFEEPWYWAQYGGTLFQYSFYLDRYHRFGDPADLQKSQSLAAAVPPSALNEFLWRRQRNFNVTSQVISYQKQFLNQWQAPLFEQVFITLDDNAEFGLNIAEADQLKSMVQQLGLDSFFNIYPGADEVLLTALSRVATDMVSVQRPRPVISVIFRNDSTKGFVPNYEGQPLNVSVLSQIRGAGAIAVGSNQIEKADVVLLVNNFDTVHQEEAPNPQSAADYSPFIQYLQYQKAKIVAFADVRYSNGGDRFFVNWMGQQKIDLSRGAYAGWNTNGNTLGTVISNAVLNSLFVANGAIANVHFQGLRLLEDVHYQALIRNYLTSYVSNLANNLGDSSMFLGDVSFYRQFTCKALQNALFALQTTFPELRSHCVTSQWFPWRRVFEIGFSLDVC